jgi:type II restriction/modification system DNA methylase subunit YeeA
MHLGEIFSILNKPRDNRFKNIDETLNKFPYIDGNLFFLFFETAPFNSYMSRTLLKCCTLDWSQIKPEIFGAMFQSVKDKEKRRELGEHYTSETNILKIIRPLFLDDLWDEFEKILKLSFNIRQQRLLEFHTKLQSLKFLDPACGCGNFLVVTYRELRKLEIEVLTEYLQSQQVIDIELLVRVNVDQFYGIEIEEFPARIAQTAMWLMDHLMNNEASKKFGKYIARIPLTASPSIKIANAFEIDWETLVQKTELSYILGNPPFVGASMMSKRQKQDMAFVFENSINYGILDYVSCWYKKAAQYIQGTNIEVAFVSTNSICQGEQVSVLWMDLFNKHNININFAHQTFKWSNEAKGKAAVYCVIVGFGLSSRRAKKLFLYPTVISDPLEIVANQINAYLVDAPVVFIDKRTKPLCKVPEMTKGSSPTDDGNLLLTQDERDCILQADPSLTEIIRPFTGAKEYLHKQARYCIWLKDISPSKYNHSKEIMGRLAKIKEYRSKSNRTATLKYAQFPSLFVENRQPDSDYIIIPRHSSENRQFIPIGFLDKNIIAGDATSFIPNATLYEFGVITSTMHMAWMRYVCGRIKSDYRYSNTIVYNNFPFPNPTAKQKEVIIKNAQGVLDARNKYPELSLAELYEATSMLPELVIAHQKLDKAVEAAYGKSFTIDGDRITHLFHLYQSLTEGLFAEKPKKGKIKKR